MAEIQTYNSVLESEAAAGASDSFKGKLAERLRRRAIINHLTALRGARGLSQEDMAKKLSCSQSKVSKLENCDDGDLRIEDLREYAKAVGLSLGIFFAPQRLGCVGRIKAHAFQIRAELDRLVGLAKGDAEIAQGVADFHGEAAVNILKLIKESLLVLNTMTELLDSDSLPDCPEEVTDDIRVELRLPCEKKLPNAESAA